MCWVLRKPEGIWKAFIIKKPLIFEETDVGLDFHTTECMSGVKISHGAPWLCAVLDFHGSVKLNLI